MQKFLLPLFFLLLYGCQEEERVSEQIHNDGELGPRVKIEMHGKEEFVKIERMDMNLTQGLGAYLEKN